MSLHYNPAPIDTSRVSLDRELSELVEMFARNIHDNWARLRIMEGWRFGAERNEASKLHPNLVPYEQLPESEKEYDRRAAMQTIKALLAIGYTIQPPIGMAVDSLQGISTDQDRETTQVLGLLKGSAEPNLVLLQGLVRGHDPTAWSRHPEIYRLLGERILNSGEPLLAYDLIAEGIKHFPRDVRLRQLLSLALARSGAAGSSNAVLTELYGEGYRDEETVGLLARTNKDLASEAQNPDEANQRLHRAFELYMQAYQATGGYWSAINAATLALVLGDRQMAASLAREVQERCRQKLIGVEADSVERYWLLSTLGEAALLLEDWPAAEDWYGQAINQSHGNWGSLQSTRHNARVLLKHLGGDDGRLERIFRFPSVVVFAGHMIDRTSREVPRFPARIEQAVKNAIRNRIEEFNAGFGYASAACGSDILFHEAMLERKAETHVVLPYERELFVRDCVDIIPGADWADRCEKVAALAVEVQEISKHCKTHSISYEFANQILHGVATIRAEQLETKLVPLAVWDGRSGDDLGGTAGTVQRWQKLGLKVEIINLREILACECPDLASGTAAAGAVSIHPRESATGFASKICALLFADAQGFSKLSDEEVQRFVEHFLGLVGDLVSRSAYRPLMKNTWGDGLYFVFSSVQDAGRFALDLRDAVRATDWPRKGLPELNVRIGLHAGPVHSCTDPVTQQLNYIGAHVSRAARIEPITPSGQVYASQAFAALAVAHGIREFRCDYVGQTSLAKHYGTFPTYVVLRRHAAQAEASHSGALG